MDLTTIPPELLLARGKYATIRSEHENAKSRLQSLCGALSAVASQVLRTMQPDSDEFPDMESVADKLKTGRDLIDKICICSAEIGDLAVQRAALKTIAWPR